MSLTPTCTYPLLLYLPQNATCNQYIAVATKEVFHLLIHLTFLLPVLIFGMKEHEQAQCTTMGVNASRRGKEP